MDPGIAIELKDVVKTYALPVATGEKGITGRTKTEKQTNTVLDRISLTVKKGEVLGIVGRNGCGKSTLLKIISKITVPDSGEVHVSGKVASILELGMGFHQDMSGRENILLKGELYGFTRKEMESRMDSIIHYSGIGRYIDSPVRTYSSGMTGRLAFSVMVNVEADIMLVDEVLSTGDAGFAGKAKDHFRKLSKSGRTVVFVSHSLPAIDDMCTRAIWLENGKVRMDGPAKKVTAAYRREIEESYEYVLDEAEAGSADAQYRLALMFRDGNGAERSTELFEHWIREAALQGHAAAQCEYADLLVSEGGEDNLAEASHLYQSSAEKGWEDAMAKVAVSGNGTEDPQRAEVKAIFRELAERGNPFDEFRYADLLLRTALTRDERTEALRWFEKAAEHGNLNAMHQAAMMHLNGTGTKKDTAKYIEYMEKAASGGRTASMMNIADAYHSGRWVAKDDAKALAWYLKAAALGVGKAQYNAAVMYRDGEGTEADPKKAEEWFLAYSRSAIVNHQIWASEAARYSKLNAPADPIKLLKEAAGNRSNVAAFQLGNIFRDGVMMPADFRKAAEMYISTEKELSFFTVAAADSICNGLGGEPDCMRALELYLKAAVTNGDPTAYLRLAHLYRDGRGTEKNHDKYIQCLLFSAERGNRDALAELVAVETSSSAGGAGLQEEKKREVNELPSVSILVPIYNVEKYLEKCLESIRVQTLKDIEVLCINDGSTDGSPAIIRAFMARDSRFKVIDKKNSGYGDSMNCGLKAAKGDFIGIVESDDFIEPGMFDTLLKLAKKDRLDIARSEFFYYENSNGKDRKSDNHFVPHNKVIRPSRERSVFYQQPSIWASLYSADFLKRNGIDFLPTPGASYQDTSFSFKVYACAQRFEMIDDAFYHYRINAGSSSFQSTTKVYCVCDEYQEIWRFIRKTGIYDEYKMLVPHLQYNGYKWNYNRLAEPYNAKFMERFRKEFKELNDAGLISGKDYSATDYTDICSIISKGEIVSQIRPLISVIIPIYNMENYLGKCLDSVVGQTLSNIEVICVNDGSTDSSLDIIKDYASKDKRITVVNKSNGGPSSARNAGLEVAKGDYISFIDSDDWIERNTYEIVLKEIADSDVVVFGTTVTGDCLLDKREEDNEYYRVKYSGRQILTDEMRLKTDVSAWNKLYRRSIIMDNNLRYPEGRLYEDYPFYWGYMLLCKTAYFEPKHLYNYLRREGSIMANTFKKTSRAIDHLTNFELIYRFADSKNLLENRSETINSIFFLCFWFAYSNSPVKYRKKVLREASEYVRDFGLNGDPVIDALREKDWEKVDPQKNYEKKRYSTSSCILRAFEKLTGNDLSTLKKMLGGTYRNADSRSDAVATTEWVQRHEDTYFVTRWSVIYDANSDNTIINSGNPGGICGGRCVSADFVKRIIPGKRYKAVLSLWGVEIAIVEGMVFYPERAVWGTCIYDGVCSYSISIDLKPTVGIIQVFACNTRNNVDYSKECRLMLLCESV